MNVNTDTFERGIYLPHGFQAELDCGEECFEYDFSPHT